MNILRRSRRVLRTDGTVRGIRYAYRIPGATQPHATGHKAQFVPMTGYAATDQPADYDPADRAYILAGPRYEPPDQWHSAPPLARPLAQARSMFPPSELGPPEPLIDHELASWLNRWFINEAAFHEVDIEALFDPSHVPKMKLAEIDAHVCMMRSYSDSVAAGDMIDAVTENYFIEPSANQLWSEAVTQAAEGLQEMAALMPTMDVQAADLSQPDAALGGDPGGSVVQPTPDDLVGHVDPATAWSQPDPVQQPHSLENIIDETMRQMDPYATIDSYGMPPGLAVPGMQMGPFGPMPPGLGPMGLM